MTLCLLPTRVSPVTSLNGPSSSRYADALQVINYIFAGIFTLEAGIKLVGLGCMGYFHLNWNRFDFAIVLGTNVGLVVQWTTGLSIGAIATIVRTFRVGRIFRLAAKFRTLRHLFETLIVALPALGNVAGLLFLVYFIFAVLGVQVRQGTCMRWQWTT